MFWFNFLESNIQGKYKNKRILEKAFVRSRNMSERISRRICNRWRCGETLNDWWSVRWGLHRASQAVQDLHALAASKAHRFMKIQQLMQAKKDSFFKWVLYSWLLNVYVFSVYAMNCAKAVQMWAFLLTLNTALFNWVDVKWSVFMLKIWCLIVIGITNELNDNC